MRAELDENGKLLLIAESPLESFALNTWWKNYRKEGKERVVTLGVCLGVWDSKELLMSNLPKK